MDDILEVSHCRSKIMEGVSALYRLKEDPTTERMHAAPDRYQGENIGQKAIPGPKTDKKHWHWHWYNSLDGYVIAAKKQD